MARPLVRVGLALTIALTGVLTSPTTVRARTPVAARGDVIDDPALVRELRRLRTGPRTEASRTALVDVELLGDDTRSLAAAVTRVGGTVTGSVDGVVVQGAVPADRVAHVAATVGLDDIRSPRDVGRRESVGTGSSVGEEVAVSGADAWHLAGLDGAGVKVGVIDYFDPTSWDTFELGPVPTVANGRLFCRDTSGGRRDCTSTGSISAAGTDLHGNAVVEIVKDMAPGATVYIATVGTLSDLDAAVAWFASKGVSIITRSLGAAYDGPGDGTGPLDEVVARAASRGITWFNSAGNDGVDSYLRRTVPTSTSVGGYVDFRSDGTSSGPDTWLRLDGNCVWLDGIRWSTDWYLPPTARTSYQIEFWEPRINPDLASSSDHWNPTTSQVIPLDVGGSGAGRNVLSADPDVGPLVAADLYTCPRNSYGPLGGVVYVRVRAASAVGASADIIEVATGPQTYLESGYSTARGSAAKPVVDSTHPAVVAVGAVDPPEGTAIADYSSQGPTTDGRTKPDMSAPAGIRSVSYGGASFSGTSAASPAAAGAAALLLDAGLAAPGQGLAALIRHLARDLGSRGDDNAFGSGLLALPTPPSPPPAPTPGAYVPLDVPARILDTRASSPVGPARLRGPHRSGAILDLPVLDGTLVPTTGVAAVAVNITSADPVSTGYVQAYPTLEGATGSTSTLNVVGGPGARPNFAIVPVGHGGKISLYLQAGGDAVVDLVGYVTEGLSTSTAGRMIPIATPERWLDTGSDRLAPRTTRVVSRPPDSAVPESGVAALVVNVTGTRVDQRGNLKVLPGGVAARGVLSSTVNMSPGSAAANQAIVRVDATGEITVTSSTAARVVIDVVGYVTDSSAADVSQGLYVPMAPTRVVDTRTPSRPFSAGELRSLFVLPAGWPTAVSAVSLNLTVTGTQQNGWLRTYFGRTEPTTSNVNAVAGRSIANAAFVRTTSGTVKARMMMSGHLIIDISGYYLT
ncbi:MAG: S8 family serine peptidase [Ilumatobacteraceae bacterium]